MTFRKFLNESNDDIFETILKSKSYAKNAAVFKNELYFETTDNKSSLVLNKKLEKFDFPEGCTEFGSMSLGYFQSDVKGILGNENAVSCIHFRFKDDVPADLIARVKAKKPTVQEIKDIIAIVKSKED